VVHGIASGSSYADDADTGERLDFWFYTL